MISLSESPAESQNLFFLRVLDKYYLCKTKFKAKKLGFLPKSACLTSLGRRMC